jgi:nucleotide-binding universal stress UspA family protein
MSTPVKHFGIVVGVDGSPASDVATCWAARDAALKNIPLTVVSVVTTPMATYPPVPYPDSLGVRLEDRGRKATAHAVKIAEDAIPTDRKVAVKSEIVFSTPAQALVKMSDEAEMIVVGSSGKGTLARGVLGSVSSSVVRHANCPVAVIRDEDPLIPDPQHAPVLVGIDGSPASQLATEIAFDQASLRGVELIALHAWSDVSAFDLPGLDWSALVSARGAQFRRQSGRLAGWQAGKNAIPT